MNLINDKVYFGIIFIIIAILSIGFASASDFTAQQARAYNASISCNLNGWYCTSTTLCNGTLVNPTDGGIVYPNQRLRLAGNYLIMNLTAAQLTKLGNFNGDIKCQDTTTGLNGSTQFVLQVTPSGLTGVLGLFVIVILMVYAIAFIGFFAKNIWVADLGGLAMISLGIYLLNNGIDVYRTTMTETFSWVTIGLGAIFALIATIELIEDNLL